MSYRWEFREVAVAAVSKRLPLSSQALLLELSEKW